MAERDVDQQRHQDEGAQCQVFYGDTHAIKDVDVDIKDKTVTAFIGPSGCGKSTFLRCLNRMNDTIDVARVEGEITLDGEDIYDPRRPGAAARQGRHGVPEAQPVPEVDLRQRRLRPAHPRLATNKAELDEIVEKSLRRAALWDEAKDRLQSNPAPGLSGGQQQRLCIARAVATEPRGAADGRALLGARPDRDGAGRGTDRRAARTRFRW
jgi:phosphate transport system ATP-binding protein